MNEKKDLIIWGAKGHSIVLYEILSNYFNLIALFDNNQSQLSPFSGIPIIYFKDGFEGWLKKYKKSVKELYFIVAIGGAKSLDRLIIHDYLISKGLTSVSAIHSDSKVSKTIIHGEGIQILINASVSSNVIIGKSVILNSSCSIDHECIISDGVHIGPGAILAGEVKVDQNTFIGAGAVILPRVHIGKNSIIGAGSLVVKNVPDNVIGFGSPFRIKRENVW